MLRKCYDQIKYFIKRNLHEFSMDEKSRVLIIAPHPDDESIGMGGFIEVYTDNLDILLVTNGALGNREWSREKTVEIREKEFVNVMKYLGVKKYYVLNVMDQEAKKNLRLLNPYLTNEYDYIFVPNRYDIHPDHNCLYKYVRRQIKRKRLKSLLVEYEVWTPLARPNYFLDIEKVLEKKEGAIRKYESQIKHAKYDWGSIGLNRYRGMLSGVYYAEAYYINKPILDRLVEKIMYRVNIIRKKRR